MAESIVQVTEGSGKKLHTNSYTVGANTVEDEVVILGPQAWPTYTIYAGNISAATAAAHVMQVMAGASLKVRIVRITVQPTAAPAGVVRLEIVRLSTAGTGGGAVTGRPFDTTDAAGSGAVGMTLPTVKGTETGAVLGSLLPNTITAAGVTVVREWKQAPSGKPIIIPAGTTNGIALKTSGLAASTFDVEIEFLETTF